MRATSVAMIAGWAAAACSQPPAATGDPDAATDGAGGDTVVDAPPAARCSGRSAQPRDAVWNLTVDGVSRAARVHVPPGYDPTRPTPLVLDFHGLSMTAATQQDLTRLPAKADQAGFVTVAPEGTGVPRGWNAGDCCAPASLSGVDDVAFTAALLDLLETRLCVDPRRVYATGFSNGAFLSHRLACELSDRIAAIAPVAGVMGVDGCAPSRPVPVFHVHGTADTLVPYDGGGPTDTRSVADSIAGWVARDGCPATPVESLASGDATCVSYRGCAGGAEVTLCTIDGGGHTWPGGGPFPGGYQSTDLSATDAMWDFFVAHPR